MLFTNQIQDCPCKHLLPTSQTTRHETLNLILQCVTRVNTVKCWPHWLGVCKESNHSLQLFPWKKYTLEENEENLEVYSEAKEREPGIKVRWLRNHCWVMFCQWSSTLLDAPHFGQNYPQLKEQAMHGCSLIWLLQTEWHAIRFTNNHHLMTCTTCIKTFVPPDN